MLVLSRRVGEQLVIGTNIVVRVNKISGDRVQIGIEAPEQTKVRRGELVPREHQQRAGGGGRRAV